MPAMRRATRRPDLTRPLAIAAAVAAFVLGAPAIAQTARSSGEGGAQAMRQLQQLAAERTELQAETARLRKQVTELEAKLAATETDQRALRARAVGADVAISRARASTGELEAEVARRKEREEQLVAEFRKTIDNLRTLETERNQFRDQAAVSGRRFDECARQNVELASIAIEVLQRYEGAGFGHALGRAEPFTRLTRTRVENLVDEYRVRVEELRVPESKAEAPR